MDELRAACAEVARRARSVRIDHDVVGAYALSLDLRAGRVDAPVGEPPDAVGLAPRLDRAGYWLSLDAINFGSGWFPTLRKSGGRSGYGTIAAAWRSRFERDGPLTAEQLAAIDAATVARVLGQDTGHELMARFAASLNDFGSRLLITCDGDPLQLVDQASRSAVAFASGLGGWPCFADHSAYGTLQVPFLKRAQIAAADLERAGVVSWADTPRLTMFADNLVPHVLRLDGVLILRPELVARIERGELIEHGSPEEVEIRACALHAVELMLDARGHDVTAMAVDELLWHRGQGPRYKAVPRHRSRTTAY